MKEYPERSLLYPHWCFSRKRRVIHGLWRTTPAARSLFSRHEVSLDMKERTKKNKIPAHTIEYRRSKQFEPVFSVPCFSLLMKKGGGNKRADLAVSEDNSIQPRHQQSRRYVTCFDHFDRSISDPGSLIYCTFYWSSIFFWNSRSQRADFRGNNDPTTRSFVNWRLSISRNTSFSAVANTCH